MKTKLIITVILLVFSTGFVFFNNHKYDPPAPIPDSEFMVGAMNMGLESQNYQNLNLNAWHVYTSPTQGWPGITGDNYLENATVYGPEVINYINANRNTYGHRTVMDRPKTEYLALSQRSEYQCETEDYLANDDYWFYTYNTVSDNVSRNYTDNTSWGSGARVRYCRTSNSTNDGNWVNSAGYVVKDLKANREQASKICGSWQANDDAWKWYVMPKIRIDEDVVNNVPETPVCSLEVRDWDGVIIKQEIIYAKYFKNVITSYDGSYLEEFYWNPTISAPPTAIELQAGEICPGPSRNFHFWHTTGSEAVHTDFRVYWYGNCDMWIDYVRVENQPAHQLFKGIWDADIADEVNLALTGYSSQNPIPNLFYQEEFEFNCLPSIKYLNNLIMAGSQNKLSLMVNFNYSLYRIHIPNWWEHEFTASQLKGFLTDGSGGLKTLVTGSYPLEGWAGGEFDDAPRGNADNRKSYHPPTLFSGNYNKDAGILSHLAAGTTAYDTWLQNRLEYGEDNLGGFIKSLKLSDALSKLSPGLNLINLHQSHMWWFHNFNKLKEPSNEELDVMANIAVTYGAKGILYFHYGSEGEYTSNLSFTRGFTGLLHPGDDPRTQNVYGQNKWQQIINMNTRLEKWGPTLMSFDNANRKSYIYRIESERYAMYQNTYFSDVFTYKYGTGPYSCAEDFPVGDVPPNNTIGECKNERYLQVATFEKPGEQNNNYFMIVNRRCSPHRPEISENGGLRRVKINLNPNSTEISKFNNWNIIDVENPLGASIPYHRGEPYVDLGWFEPGQGKLYKMIPTVNGGGILSGNENITGQTFTCEAPVYNNGFNITIGANTTIHFNDSSKFVMSGGVFTVGDQHTSAPQNITSDAVPGGSWRGHSFTNCEVKIYGATFTGLANDTTYAVNIIDCPVVDIRNCTFNTNSSLKGGVNAICFNNPFIAINNIYIGSNTFNSAGSTIPTVNVSSFAGVTTPLIIENNIFNEGNTAVFLSGVIGGAIKGNTITDNYIGINALTSSIDVVQNNISSTVSGSMGIFAAGGSELKLNSSGAFTLGGLNNISNEGTGTNNINVDGSYFLLDDGENVFNISSDQSSYHLYGYFPMFAAVTTEETNNCFKVNSSPVDPPINMVTSGYQGSQITFNFIPYLAGCEFIQGGDFTVINLGSGVYDTIYTGGSGSGGSQSSVASVRRTDIKQNSQTHAFDLPSAKTKYDSISVLMRYRNYTQAKTKCLDLINTYPDSIQSIFAVSKLFLATVASDTSYNAANTLKIFYENLILNHPGNTSLVKRANYYILKCKVRMREYSQALAGFQQIINQNPYSYEGLIARWDYMATSLLVQGQGGGEPSIRNYELGITNNTENGIDVGQRHAFDYSDIDGNDDDRKPFTKEQRQDIRKSINTAIEISKNDDEVKIKKLEEKSELGDVNASKELTQMKSLKQVVKTEKPKSITQHVRIVSEDIRKVFGSNTSSKGNETKNIPLVFRISQNYPNPFNPVTKINYDLPKDSKVKIVIYDILGREVKRLVNNELKTAGSYIVDFNAMNYASGVYFYRIEAEEPNGNKFVDSKKMVLLK